jgi:acyl carrier protein
MEKLLNKIKSLLDVDDDTYLSVSDNLVTSGRLNSLKIVELAVWLEKTYGIDFSESGFNIYDFENVLTIMDLIKKKR